MTPKFKVGDVVYLKKYENIHDDNNVGIIGSMRDFFGTQVTIKSIDTRSNGNTVVYTILEDDLNWLYDQEWFDDNPQNRFNWEEL